MGDRGSRGPERDPVGRPNSTWSSLHSSPSAVTAPASVGAPGTTTGPWRTGLSVDGRPVIIGYAHHFQLVDHTLPRHSWDVPLDVLVTEQEARRWTGGSCLAVGPRSDLTPSRTGVWPRIAVAHR